MSTRLSKTNIVLAKLETIYGTDANPTEAIKVLDLEINPLEGDTVTAGQNRPYLGAERQIQVNSYVTVSFKIELAGSGATGVAPAWGQLMEVCGMKETIDASKTNPCVLYSPISEAIKSLTFYVNRAGTLHSVTGVRGSWSLPFEQGDIPKINFTFTGLFNDPSSQAIPTTVDYSKFKDAVPAVKNNTSNIKLHGNDIIASSLSFDMSGETPFISYLNEERVSFTDRQASGAIEIQDQGINNINLFSLAKNSTPGMLSIQHGNVAGNIIDISCPAVQVLNPSYGDKNGEQVLSANLSLLPVNGNDEIKVIVR